MEPWTAPFIAFGIVIAFVGVVLLAVPRVARFMSWYADWVWDLGRRR